MTTRSIARRLGGVALLAVLVVGLTACDPPTTVATTVTYDCEIATNNPLLGTFSDDLAGDYEVTAPQAVKPGKEFEVEVVPEPFTMSASSSGGTVSEISNVVWRVAVPTGSTLVSQSIAGWANVGPGAPTSSVSGANVVVTVPGPIPANAATTFPTITMTLTTTGALGTRIAPAIGGTSYTSPGLSLNAKVTGTILGTLTPSLRCFPSPATGLHSVLISNDVSAPSITVTSPTAGQTIPRGATVLAGYSCSDGSGVGVASCVGTVANGAALNTATAGARTFTVTATDLEGKVSTKAVDYTVVS